MERACSSPEEFHDTLIQFLKGHGVAASADGDWVRCSDGIRKWQGLIFSSEGNHPNGPIQLDIRFSPWHGCMICEADWSCLKQSRKPRVPLLGRPRTSSAIRFKNLLANLSVD